MEKKTTETTTTTATKDEPERTNLEERALAEGAAPTAIRTALSKTRSFSRAAGLRQQQATRRATLAPLLALPEATRIRIVDGVPWAPSTRSTMWACLCALARDIGYPMSPLARATQKRYDTEAQTQGATWTKDPQNFADIDFMKTLVPRARSPLILAALLAWSLGARVGDILRIKTANVHTNVQFPHCVVHSFSLVEGKTVAHTGPYTVFLSTAVPFSDDLVEHVRSRGPMPYLFLQTQTMLARDPLAKAVLTAERALHEELGNSMDLRAFRRGGLSNLSAEGFSDEDVRTFSMHTGNAQLQTYLLAGRFNGARAMAQEKMTRSQWSEPKTQE